MASPLPDQNPQIIQVKYGHDQFAKKLKNLSKDDGIWNGYLIVKDMSLTRVNFFQYLAEKLFGNSTPQALNNIVILYVRNHIMDVQSLDEVKMMAKLAEKAGLTPRNNGVDTKTKDNLNELFWMVNKKISELSQSILDKSAKSLQNNQKEPNLSSEMDEQELTLPLRDEKYNSQIKSENNKESPLIFLQKLSQNEEETLQHLIQKFISAAKMCPVDELDNIRKSLIDELYDLCRDNELPLYAYAVLRNWGQKNPPIISAPSPTLRDIQFLQVIYNNKLKT